MSTEYHTFICSEYFMMYDNLVFQIVAGNQKHVVIQKTRDILVYKFYFQLLHKASFYAPTCVGYPL
jgi:hypothetical protein